MLTKTATADDIEPLLDMAGSADAASLVYCSDADPGYRRRGQGPRFRYVDSQGKPVRDRRTLDRIAALVIPPAWTDVWIASRPDCHLQATGRDQRGRKQYRYHDRWRVCRDEVKFSTLPDFARALPAIRRRIDADLRRPGLPRDKVLAAIVRLLDVAMIRVGNEAYSRENKSFGLTTLRNRHVAVEGAAIRFAFRGKSGKEWKVKVTDRRLARIIKDVQDLPGQKLFQYLGEDGGRHSVGSQDINAYIRDAAGPLFTSKHFRTWTGTVLAATRLAEETTEDGAPPTARALNAVIDEAARKLGNTRTVCRDCYIHPAVIAAWKEGRLAAEMLETRRRFRKTPDGLDRDEAIVLRWMETAR
ncbi:MAG: DNA topoisomerase IB [Rhizobiaceae bacterium]|nr:DNA topoisomerase IB [Rhizobiaceae bacterium]